MQPRSAKSVGLDFPYQLRTICYFEVFRDGTVSWKVDDGTVARVRADETKLYAVWPGEWSSDLFLVDDIDEFEKGRGLRPDPTRSGLEEHEHQVRWWLDDTDTGRGSYATVRLTLDCGCTIRDIREFARHMRDQKGWVVATTSGWGIGRDQAYVRVRRGSLQTDS